MEITSVHRSIIRLTAQGKNSKEIGQKLNLSFRTIEKYRGDICTMAGVPNITALVDWAYRNQILLDPTAVRLIRRAVQDFKEMQVNGVDAESNDMVIHDLETYLANE